MHKIKRSYVHKQLKIKCFDELLWKLQLVLNWPYSDQNISLGPYNAQYHKQQCTHHIYEQFHAQARWSSFGSVRGSNTSRSFECPDADVINLFASETNENNRSEHAKSLQ